MLKPLPPDSACYQDSAIDHVSLNFTFEMKKLIPLEVDSADLVGWTNKKNLAFFIAKTWAKYMPRGKGWVPRKIGESFWGNTRTTIKTKYGALLAIDPSSLDVYISITINDGVWDQHIFNSCKKLLSTGDVFYDIGANVGYYSIEVAKLFGDRVRILSFEPQPSLCRVVAISGALNELRNLEVYEAMIGAENGCGEIFIPRHSIHASSISRETGAKRINCLKVTLDDAIDDGLPPPNIIKMDVEGGELEVIQGASKTLKNFSPMIIFESDENSQRFGYSRRILLDEIGFQSDYLFFFVNNEEFIPISCDNLNNMEFRDILAIPKNKANIIV
jgi:FkbM family methyltransferase